jgi:hypothetical protein
LAHTILVPVNGKNNMTSENNEQKDWSVRQGTLDSKPIFTSFRASVDTEENHKKYPFQIGVAVPLINPTADGLPTTEEAKELWAIIDVLQKKLADKFETIYVMSLTIEGMREFVFYTPEWKPQEIENIVKEIEKEVGDGHELQFMMQEDKKWETFKKYSDSK